MEQELCGERRLHAATVQVCMTCLDTDSQMFSVSECKLEQAYEHLTGYPLFDVGNLQHSLCAECAQRLTNFDKFRDRSLRARALMMDLVKQHEVITRQHIAALRPLDHSMQASVETAWDSADVASVKTVPDLRAAWDSADVASVKTVPDLRADWDSADAQASDSEDAQASVKSEGSASMLRDAKLLDEALCRVLLTRMSRVEERALATRDLLKCENVTLQCTECGEEFSREREYNEHAHSRHRTTRASEGCSATDVLAARLANTDDEREHPDNTEQAEAIDKCEQVFGIDNDEADNKPIQKYNEPTQCIKSPLNICSFSDLVSKNNDTDSGETESQDELPISETNESVTSHIVTVDKVFLNNDSDVGNIVTMETTELSYSAKHVEETSNYICDICQHRFKCKNLLVKHIMAHSIEEPFLCELCQYKFSQNSDLVQHMRTHTGDKPFSCELCQYKCSRKSALVLHMRIHTGEKPFVCELCQYKCVRNSHLVLHMRTHTGDKPFSCELCQYKCSRKSDLVQHMRIHTGEKTFVCELCQYKCVRNSHLVLHMRTHTGEKPYVCKICHYKFAQNSHLVQHMRTHTGEKRFACEFCSYKCAAKSSLLKHMRSHSHNS